jgi:tyrosyl-tRNA synthetase
VGLDGVRRMGKSLGNYIGISEPPYEMMKKFMQLPDAVMPMYFELLTDLPLAQIETLLAGHPKEAKIALAKSVIGQYHNAGVADEAALKWQREIGEKAMPEEILTVRLSRGSFLEGDFLDKAQRAVPYHAVVPVRLLIACGLCSTTSDARRVISQGGAYYGVDKKPIVSKDQLIDMEPGLLLWVGKKRVRRVEFDE